MTPVVITVVLTALAALVVILTRVRLLREGSAGRSVMAPVVTHVHTVSGTVALGCWVAMLVTGSELLGWIGLACWWVTVLAGLTVLLRWLPGGGRHAGGAVGDSWGEGPGLSLLAHVGLLLGVLIFTIYLVVGELPPY